MRKGFFGMYGILLVRFVRRNEVFRRARLILLRDFHSLHRVSLNLYMAIFRDFRLHYLFFRGTRGSLFLYNVGVLRFSCRVYGGLSYLPGVLYLRVCRHYVEGVYRLLLDTNSMLRSLIYVFGVSLYYGVFCSFLFLKEWRQFLCYELLKFLQFFFYGFFFFFHRVQFRDRRQYFCLGIFGFFSRGRSP